MLGFAGFAAMAATRAPPIVAGFTISAIAHGTSPFNRGEQFVAPPESCARDAEKCRCRVPGDDLIIHLGISTPALNVLADRSSIALLAMTLQDTVALDTGVLVRRHSPG